MAKTASKKSGKTVKKTTPKKPTKKRQTLKTASNKSKLEHGIKALTDAKSSRPKKSDATPKKTGYSKLLESIGAYLSSGDQSLSPKQRQKCEELLQGIGLIDKAKRRQRTEEAVRIAFAITSASVRKHSPAMYALYSATTEVASKPVFSKLVPTA